MEAILGGQASQSADDGDRHRQDPGCLSNLLEALVGGWNAKGEHRKPRILFLADRNVLVDDPKDKTFAPFGDARCKIENGEAIKSREMYFAIYQAIAKDETPAGALQASTPRTSST